MPITWEHGPMVYREIQKNAYLKRIPDEGSGSKHRPLGNKKPQLKAMWTLFCVHNGKFPFLEQYPSAESPAALSHTPVWAASLHRARHVTASVQPHANQQYDFLVDTDHGPIRMLAPDWASMAEWVRTLRTVLQELRILSAGLNVYSEPAAPAAPRAGTRDPTSPLPPTPPAPRQRIPGIEIVPAATRQPPIAETPEYENMAPESTPPLSSSSSQTTTTLPTSQPVTATSQTVASSTQPFLVASQPVCSTSQPVSETIDISNWDTYRSMPSTSTSDVKSEPKKSVTKISGQSICLDDSILKRNVTDSDEEFFQEIDKIHSSGESLALGCFKEDFKQRFLVSDKAEASESSKSDYKGTNITVIEVSNKGPPHTAIPVLGKETDVFNFDFKQNLKIESEDTEKPINTDNFINIVNTEVNVQNTDENTCYGTVFNKDNESEYGHLSLTTTTVNLTGDVDSDSSRNEGVYERLCLASTSNPDKSPLPLRRIKNNDRIRKSSLPNLDFSPESAYEYLYLKSSQNNNNVTCTGVETQNGGPEAAQNGRQPDVQEQNGRTTTTSVTEINSNSAVSVNSNRHNVQVNLTSSTSIGGTRGHRANNIERSHSQNAYDGSPRRELRRVLHNSPKRDGKSDSKKPDANQKPIWKRGLTELSLLSRLRGIGQKKDETAVCKDSEEIRVTRRSRVDASDTRRRSSSLSNGDGAGGCGAGQLQPLVVRAAAWLRAEQRRGASLARLHAHHQAPLLAAEQHQVWIALWAGSGARFGGRSGDRLAAVRGIPVKDVPHAKQLFKTSPHPVVDVLFHKVPLAKIFVIHKRESEPLGIKLDNECNIVEIAPESCAARAGLVAGPWAVTQVNNRNINLIKGGEEEMLRISRHGTEVSILVQPSSLVKKIRAAIKANKSFLNLK